MDPLEILIDTKIHPPKIRKDRIPRPRLLEKIESHLGKLILLSAPAGFGKTTLILDWLNEKQYRYSWLSLDNSDNNLNQFFTYFITSIQALNTKIGEKTLNLLKGSGLFTPDIGLILLINDLNTFNNEIFIVLDDYHCIDEQSINNSLRFFLDHIPDNVHLVISSRVDPLLPLSRLRVKNELLEIREHDLRFTVDETKDFFSKTMCLDLSDENIKSLESRTEGWIAALQMAGISMQHTQDKDNFVKVFTGNNKYIADYLLDEVLSHQPKETQDFLLKSSALDKFNAPLCDFIMNINSSREIINQLDQENLFLVALDEHREWYRYNHLFSELLLHRMASLFNENPEELYYRASRWFENNNKVNEAIVYASKMENKNHLLSLLDMHCLSYVSSVGPPVLNVLLANIPNELINKYPMIIISRVWGETNQPLDFLEKSMLLAEQSLKSPDCNYSDEKIKTTQYFIDAICAIIARFKGNLQESVTKSTKILSKLSGEHTIIKGLINLNLARSYFEMGYVEKTLFYLELCYKDAKETNSSYIILAVLSEIYQLKAVEQGFQTIRNQLENIILFAESEGLNSLPIFCHVLYHISKILYELDELSEAQKYIEQAFSIPELSFEPAVYSRLLLLQSKIFIAQKKEHNFMDYVIKIEELKVQNGLRLKGIDIETEKAFLFMLINKPNEIEEWIRLKNNLYEKEFNINLEYEVLVIIKFYLFTGEFKKSQKMLLWLSEQAKERGRKHIILLTDIFFSIQHHKTNKEKETNEFIDKAISFASQKGFIRSFLDFGSVLIPILTNYLSSYEHPPENREYAKMLLIKFGLDENPVFIPKFTQTLIEPLTEREQEVLFYMNKNLANKEISEKLFISIDTLKTHIRHIYSKIDAKDRKSAIQKAKELGLIK